MTEILSYLHIKTLFLPSGNAGEKGFLNEDFDHFYHHFFLHKTFKYAIHYHYACEINHYFKYLLIYKIIFCSKFEESTFLCFIIPKKLVSYIHH